MVHLWEDLAMSKVLTLNLHDPWLLYWYAALVVLYMTESGYNIKMTIVCQTRTRDWDGTFILIKEKVLSSIYYLGSGIICCTLWSVWWLMYPCQPFNTQKTQFPWLATIVSQQLISENWSHNSCQFTLTLIIQWMIVCKVYPHWWFIQWTFCL